MALQYSGFTTKDEGVHTVISLMRCRRVLQGGHQQRVRTNTYLMQPSKARRFFQIPEATATKS